MEGARDCDAWEVREGVLDNSDTLTKCQQHLHHIPSYITIYDPFRSYVIPCSKMHMIFNDQDESTVCLDGSKLFSPHLVLTGGGVATREPGGGVAQGETLRLGIWGSTKPGPGSMDEIHYTSTHHLVFLQNFGKSFSRLSWKSKQLLVKELSNKSLSFIKAISQTHSCTVKLSYEYELPVRLSKTNRHIFLIFSGKLQPDVLELLRDGRASTSLEMLSCVTILVFEEGLKVSKGRFDLCHCRLLIRLYI